MCYKMKPRLNETEYLVADVLDCLAQSVTTKHLKMQTKVNKQSLAAK